MLSRGEGGQAGVVILTFCQEFLSKLSAPDNMFYGQSLPKRVTMLKQVLLMPFYGNSTDKNPT